MATDPPWMGDLQHDHSQDSNLSTEETLFEDSGITSGPLTLPSMYTWRKDPTTRVEILHMPDKIRFRYNSEARRFLCHQSSHQSKVFGKLQVNDFVGPLTITIDLVYGSSGKRHDNEVYLIAKRDDYQDDNHGHITFFTVQTKSVQTYELPIMGVLRTKTCSSCQSTRPYDRDRVHFRFTVKLGDAYPAVLISDPVYDSKGDRDQPILCHMNPSTGFQSQRMESTILCSGISSRCRVFFESLDSRFRVEAPVLLAHKRCALVVSVPRVDAPVTQTRVFLMEPEGRVSDPRIFRFAPNPPELKVEPPGDSRKRLLSYLARKKQCLDVDSPSENDVADLCFLLGAGLLQLDDCLSGHLAHCPSAMLTLNENGLTPLAAAILNDRNDVANAFLEKMSNYLTANLMHLRLTDAQRTHLHVTAFSAGQYLPLGLMARLIELGCDPLAGDADDNSLLHLLLHTDDGTVKLGQLLRARTREEFSWVSKLLNAMNTAGFTPLHEAVIRSNLNGVTTLLKAGADVNRRTRSSGLTALHYAVLENQSLKMVCALLTVSDVDINALTLDGRTALDIAVLKGNEELSEVLENAGGEQLLNNSTDENEEEEEEVDPSQPQPREGKPWEEVCDILNDSLTPDEFLRLGEAVLSESQARLLWHTASPANIFFRFFSRRSPAELVAPLRDLEKADLADLVANAQIT